MLTVKTNLAQSSVHGIGLFADQFISSGEVVWQFHPGVDLVYEETAWRDLLAGISPASGRAIKNYSYKEKGLFYLCVDNGQFMNHSQDEKLVNIFQEPGNDVMRALRDIKRGEELFCNYHHYSDFDDMHRCRLMGDDEAPAILS